MNYFCGFKIKEATEEQMVFVRLNGKCIASEGFVAYRLDDIIYVDEIQPIRDYFDSKEV